MQTKYRMIFLRATTRRHYEILRQFQAVSANKNIGSNLNSFVENNRKRIINIKIYNQNITVKQYLKITVKKYLKNNG